jgi:intraflagellar transport protein 46
VTKKEEDNESSDDDDKEDSAEFIDGQYNAQDYAHLNVSSEIKELFQYITRFKAQEVELDSNLKCFIPDYIPAIGDMDSFLKVSRPDGKPDTLGLKTLDEPSSTQSDPTVLELQLRAVSKKQQYGDVVVRSIENASKFPSAIDKWIANISDLHRTKPPPQVHYKRNMPDTET